MIVAGGIAIVAIILALGVLGWPVAVWVRAVAGVVFFAAVGWLALLARQWRQPRLAYANGELLVYLRRGGPLHVPLDVVECFLLGQADSFLPGQRNRPSETSTVVVRLAERAEAWQHIEVEPTLGSWCDGHIVIRGTWCEPIGLDVVNRLNRRLGQVRRARREDAQA